MEAMVPTVPGLVSEMVVPWKSATASLLVRALATRSSKAARYCGEGHGAGVLDVGDDQAARAVLAGDIDRETEVDFLLQDAEGLAGGVPREGVIEAGVGLHGAHDRPADEVRVGNLALAERGRGGD